MFSLALFKSLLMANQPSFASLICRNVTRSSQITGNNDYNLQINQQNRKIMNIMNNIGTNIEENNENEEEMNNGKHELVFKNINRIIKEKNFGQTFAIIHLYGRQYLIHLNDIIAVKTSLSADCGERIKLEKCLLIGNENFTLIGRPILDRDLVQIEATIVEKTMTQTQMNMKHIPRRHGYKRYLFERDPLTMLRINNIEICHQLNSNQNQIN